MVLLCHLEVEIYRITVFITPIIEDRTGINPSHKFVQISDISPREILVNFFFLTNIYNEDLKYNKKPFEVIFGTSAI